MYATPKLEFVTYSTDLITQTGSSLPLVLPSWLLALLDSPNAGPDRVGDLRVFPLLCSMAVLMSTC